MTFQVSPGVNVSEIDLTTGIPAVSVSTGALAGHFNWGPVEEVTAVTNEVDLVAQFGEPNSNSANDFFTASNFLQYSNDLRVVRTKAQGAINASADGSGILVLNDTDYFNNGYNTISATNSFAARYPGAIGNSLKVYVFANTVGFTDVSTNANSALYSFANYFNAAPGSSRDLLRKRGGAVVGDELHVIVVDSKGYITGTANTVLEKYPNLSRLTDAVGEDGSSIYYKEVIFRNSKYVHVLGTPSSNTNGWNSTTALASNTTLSQGSTEQSNTATLAGGLDGTTVAANTFVALDKLSNSDTVDISLLLTAAASNTVTNYAISIAESRKDIVVFASPSKAAAQDASSPATAINTYVNTLTRSSYAFIDSGWKYMYDKYNDVYRWVPLNGDIAGLAARTDNNRDPWWSPAGIQRGQIKNVVRLAYNPSKADRDTLYKNGVNPVVSFPGEGTLLYGDKTFLNYTSAFDHINVRRLFIVLEKAIAKASRAQLFEFNDAFTRAQFVAMVEPFLRVVKGRRGVYDYRVVCDETNNPAAIVDANQFVGDIYVKPARSINYIQLNFIAVRTGVEFSEVVGQF